MRRRPRHMVPILLLQHVNISSAFPLNFTELQFLINLSMIIELLILCHAYNFISDFFSKILFSMNFKLEIFRRKNNII